jgi:endoglucanase
MTQTLSDAAHPQKTAYLRWLMEVTAIPTAAGREGRVIAWVRDWLDARPDLAWRADRHGNIEIRSANVEPTPDDAPLYFTAHLDHPAFVVRRALGNDGALVEFRGGVMAEYFEDARVVVHPDGDGPERVPGVLVTKVEGPDVDEGSAFPVYEMRFDTPAAVSVGDVATWELPRPEVVEDEFGGILHTDGCDDLAAVAGALCALEELRRARRAGEAIGDVRVLLTRAEEIGFIGCIGVCRDGFLPRKSKVIALENSRSFPHDSPIHGGPIVRVGDRVSVFTPELTAAVAEVAERLAGRSAHPLAIEKAGPAGGRGGWRWQRKLMPGGACEASVFCQYGYAATCVCLPLGNYHNMADLAAVQAKTNTARPRVGREFIGVDDYFGMVDLLAACGRGMPSRASFAERVEKLWAERSFVLNG